jgi:citrate lyase subunit beta/citryl-CoA lyase
MVRSWLFAPGHSERMLVRVFEAGADAPLLDLEDAVSPDQKGRARALVAEALASHPGWVRVNRPGTDVCAADLAAVGGLALGLRLPKVESAADVAWVRQRLAGRDVPLTASIESAPGVLRALEIAGAPGVVNLAFGNVDFGHGVWVRYRDPEGLRAEAGRARRLGFFGKSAIHPAQVPVINEVFSPTPEEVGWARRVLEAFEASGGAATRVDGEMIDVPVAERARRLLGM